MRKCKNCGRMFEPKAPGDFFCSSLCRVTGNFVGGGGDTTKPMSEEQRKDMIRRGRSIPTAKAAEPKPKKIRNGGEKFPRVAQMFALPIEKRWEISKNFTEEERDYARRVMKRMLMEERKMESLTAWDGTEDGESAPSSGLMFDGSIGDSDDGTV